MTARRIRGPALGLLLLACVPYFVGLGDPPLWDANEPLYAQPPNEIVRASHDSTGETVAHVLAPTSNGTTYFAHAPFSTWATLPFYVTLGVSEFSARLPMALAAVFTILMTVLLATRLYGAPAGLWAGLVLAATPRYWLFARQLAGDVWLVAFLVGALALAVPAVSGTGTERRRMRDLRLAHVLVGVGTLAKGPLIWVLYFGTLGLAWLVARRPVPLKSLRPMRALLLIVALGAPWSIYMAVRFPEFLEQHYGWYHGARLIGGIGERGMWFYPVALLGDAQPWLLGVPLAVRYARRIAVPFAAWFPWLGALFVLVLFTISSGKRNVYLLPMYPLLAVGLSPWLVHVFRARPSRATRWVALGAASAGFVTAGLLVRVGIAAPGLTPELWGVVGVAGAGGLVLAFLSRRASGAGVLGATVALLIVLQTSVAHAFPALTRYRPVPRFAAEILAQRRPAASEPALLYAVPIHSLNFYVGFSTHVTRSPQELHERIARLGPGFVVTDARYVDALPAGARPRVVGRHLPTHAPGLRIEELDRAPELAFRFDRTILGRGASTRDLVLLYVRAEGAPPKER